MLGYLVMFLILIELPAAHTLSIDSNGVVDEMVVTAPRYEHEDVAWSGMMPEVVVAVPRYLHEMGMIDEIVVNAPRYANEDAAWSGMMPEIICAASNDITPQVVYKSLKIITEGEDKWYYRLLIIETNDSHILLQRN